MNHQDFHQIIRNYTIRHDRTIKKICSPLNDNFGIDCFTHYTIDSSGGFTYLSNSTEQSDYFFYNQLHLLCPYFIDPDLIREGFVITDTTPDPESFEIIDKRFGMRKLLLMIKKNKGVMEGTIFLKKNVEMVPNLFLSNLHLLVAFEEHFKREARSFIENMRFDGYSMKQAKGSSFFECSSDLPLKAHSRCLKKYLKSISPLSPREQECLDLYSKGYNSKETAELLGISHRTVEHHFERMKDKLGCHFKRELIQKAF